jgi:tetratricopeptide (TPR) repeat protein
MLTKQRLFFPICLILAGQTTALWSVSLFFPSKGLLFAQEETHLQSSQIKDLASLESEQVEKAEFGLEVTEKVMPSYGLSLKEIIEEAKKNIKKVEERMREQEIFKRNQEREIKIRQYFKQGNLLFEQGKLKEANEAYNKVLRIIKEPEMKDYIQKTEKITFEKELIRKQEELARQKQEREQKKSKSI